MPICIWPFTRDAEPNTFLPSLMVTVPVGGADAVEVTTAVKVTVCPKGAGFNDDVSVVVVGAGSTIWKTLALLGPYPLLPL